MSQISFTVRRYHDHTGRETASAQRQRPNGPDEPASCVPTPHLRPIRISSHIPIANATDDLSLPPWPYWNPVQPLKLGLIRHFDLTTTSTESHSDRADCVACNPEAVLLYYFCCDMSSAWQQLPASELISANSTPVPRSVRTAHARRAYSSTTRHNRRTQVAPQPPTLEGYRQSVL